MLRHNNPIDNSIIAFFKFISFNTFRIITATDLSSFLHKSIKLEQSTPRIFAILEIDVISG